MNLPDPNPTAAHCPFCGSSDFKRIGDDGATCNGCGVGLQWHHTREQWASLVALLGGDRRRSFRRRRSRFSR